MRKRASPVMQKPESWASFQWEEWGQKGCALQEDCQGFCKGWTSRTLSSFITTRRGDETLSKGQGAGTPSKATSLTCPERCQALTRPAPDGLHPSTHWALLHPHTSLHSPNSLCSFLPLSPSRCCSLHRKVCLPRCPCHHSHRVRGHSTYLGWKNREDGRKEVPLELRSPTW